MDTRSMLASDDTRAQQIAAKWLRLEKEFDELDRALSRARTIAVTTGRYSDPAWFKRTEARVREIRRERQEIQREMQDRKTVRKKANLANAQERFDAMKNVIERNFGRAALLSLLAEVEAQFE